MNFNRPGEKVVTLYAKNIPFLPGQTHKYKFDREDFDQGRDSITLFMDNDGNGSFEKTIKSDIELTCEEYLNEIGN